MGEPSKSVEAAVVDAWSHPLLRGLVLALPPPGAVWMPAERLKWFVAAGSIFDLVYDDPRWAARPTLIIEAADSIRAEARTTQQLVLQRSERGPAPNAPAAAPSVEVAGPTPAATASNEGASRADSAPEARRDTETDDAAAGTPPVRPESLSRAAASSAAPESGAAPLADTPSQPADRSGRTADRDEQSPDLGAAPGTTRPERGNVGAQILALLRESGSAGLMARDLIKEVQASEGYVRLMIQELKAAGDVVLRGWTRNARWYLPEFAPAEGSLPKVQTTPRPAPALQPGGPAPSSSPRPAASSPNGPAAPTPAGAIPIPVAHGLEALQLRRAESLRQLSDEQRAAFDVVCANPGCNHYSVAEKLGRPPEGTQRILAVAVRLNLLRGHQGRYWAVPIDFTPPPVRAAVSAAPDPQ